MGENVKWVRRVSGSGGMLFAVAAILGCGGVAWAAPQYYVTGKEFSGDGISTTTGDHYSVVGSLDVGDEARYGLIAPPYGSILSIGSSIAGFGGLHAAASTAVNNYVFPDGALGLTPQFSFGAQSTAQGSYTIRVDGAGTAPVPISLNVRLDGAVTAGGTADPAGGVYSAYSTGSVAFYVTVPGAPPNQDIGSGQVMASIGRNQDNIYTREGLLANWTSFGTFTTNTFMAVPGTTFTLTMQLGAGASLGGDGTRNAEIYANSNFGDTMTFATDGPVFNVPAGYTVNSADAGIVNNLYVVPEPRGGGVVVGVIGLTLARRRR